MKQIIHVNQHKIRSNKKHSLNEPVLTVKTYKSNEYAHNATLMHNNVIVAKIIYSPDKPLSCGAKVWIEVDTDIIKVLLDQ